MDSIGSKSIALVRFELMWRSAEARHTETLFGRINFWRDSVPEKVRDALAGKRAGDEVRLRFRSGELVGPHQAERVFPISREVFDDTRARPYFGRFYPGQLLKDPYDVIPGTMEPFRCVGVKPSELVVDFNHPLSRFEVNVKIAVREVRQQACDRGGRCASWADVITDGPGMQARWEGEATDFGWPEGFTRADEEDDGSFYQQPRFVIHTDSWAVNEISNLYGRLLKKGTRVLDLMSGWRSHVPKVCKLRSLIGLGLNRKEMEENPELTSHVIHDINRDPKLSFDDGSFDAVICTVSVEYMTHPVEVFTEIARVLKPKGCFILTFSNRWFPPKVIRLWTDLHEFERMGIVLDYFLRTGRYRDLETFSSRGAPRPDTDRYYPRIKTADPVHAVWGKLAG